MSHLHEEFLDAGDHHLQIPCTGDAGDLAGDAGDLAGDAGEFAGEFIYKSKDY